MRARSRRWEDASVDLFLIVLSVVLAMALILVGLASVQNLPTSDMFRERIAMPAWLWRTLGVADLVAAAGLVVGAFAAAELALVSALLAAISLIVVLTYQWRSKDALATQVPVLVLLSMSLATMVVALTTS
jgi:hypothetical protein